MSGPGADVTALKNIVSPGPGEAGEKVKTAVGVVGVGEDGPPTDIVVPAGAVTTTAFVADAERPRSFVTVSVTAPYVAALKNTVR